MTTSGTFVFTVSRDDIVREAMLNIGKIGATEVPDPTELTDCSRKLNMLVKQWMGRQDFAPGLKAFSIYRGDLFLSQSRYRYALGPSGDWAGGITVAQPNGENYNQATLTAAAAANATTITVGTTEIAQFTAGDYVVFQLNSGDIYSTTVATINSGAGTFTIPATGLPSAAASGNFLWNYTTKGQRPLQILTCLLRDTTWNDTPIDMMTLQTYELQPNKTMPTFLSDPTAIYYEPQTTGVPSTANGYLYLDCGGAQDVTKRLHITYLAPVMDFNNPADNPQYPQEWYRALCWGLAKEICPMFNAVWTKEMDGNYVESMAMAREANSETTEFYFMPNSGSPYSP